MRRSPLPPNAAVPKCRPPAVDGRTHLAYKLEHAMDLDTGAVVAAEMHLADQGDTATLPGMTADQHDAVRGPQVDGAE